MEISVYEYWNTIYSLSRSFSHVNNYSFIPFYWGDISGWILKQKNFANELLAFYQIHDLNRVSKLINRILLFQYSEGIFSAPGIGVALNFAHSTQPITCFLTRKSLFLHPCSCWDISVWILKQKNFVNELLASFQVQDLIPI